MTLGVMLRHVVWYFYLLQDSEGTNASTEKNCPSYETPQYIAFWSRKDRFVAIYHGGATPTSRKKVYKQEVHKSITPYAKQG